MKGELEKLREKIRKQVRKELHGRALLSGGRRVSSHHKKKSSHRRHTSGRAMLSGGRKKSHSKRHSSHKRKHTGRALLSGGRRHSSHHLMGGKRHKSEKGRPRGNPSAIVQISKMAKELRAKNPRLTQAEAISKASAHYRAKKGSGRQYIVRHYGRN